MYRAYITYCVSDCVNYMKFMLKIKRTFPRQLVQPGRTSCLKCSYSFPSVPTAAWPMIHRGRVDLGQKVSGSRATRTHLGQKHVPIITNSIYTPIITQL